MADHGIWMPIYWGDYLGKTSGLSCEEHGAYLLLICAYWQRGKPLPDDDRYLSTATRLTLKKWRIIRPKILYYFGQKDGELIHDRIEKELLRSCERISSGKAGAHARWHASHMPSTPTTTPTKEESKKVILGNFGGKKRGVEMTPENRLCLFHNWLAPLLGEDGWKIIAEAMNPQSEYYAVAVETCKITAKKHGKGWPHQWPK